MWVQKCFCLGAINTFVFGNFTSGCLHTDDAFYWTEECEGVQSMKYDDLKSIVLMGSKINDGVLKEHL